MNTSPNKRRVPLAACLPVRLHHDQRGVISIVAVFTLMLLTMLVGMVFNVGRQVDGKVRMQNAADAVAYSGGVVMARGMNTLVFTNHMLCEIFAMTAFMREARDANSEKFVPEILAAWAKVGPVFSSSGFPKFERLGPAIVQKTSLEGQMVIAYSQWVAAVSQPVLPLMEEILSEELIPKYQRAVVAAFPDIAQMAALEIARRNADPDLTRGRMLGAMWRTTGQIVGGDNEAFDPSLPVVDPTASSEPRYLDDARSQRKRLARQYLRDWNNETMAAFDQQAKMCQFSTLWRSFTCGYLSDLLDKEYPHSNLPFQIRTPPGAMGNVNAHIEQCYMFVGVVYWRKLPQALPGLFRNPMDNDGVAFAQVQVFLPTQRLEWHWIGAGGGGGGQTPIGGVPGEFPPLPGEPPTGPTGGGGPGRWVVGRQGIPTSWDLLTQHWNCQLVPATGPNLNVILQSVPPLPAFNGVNLTLPNLGGLDTRDIEQISFH